MAKPIVNQLRRRTTLSSLAHDFCLRAAVSRASANGQRNTELLSHWAYECPEGGGECLIIPSILPKMPFEAPLKSNGHLRELCSFFRFGFRLLTVVRSRLLLTELQYRVRFRSARAAPPKSPDPYTPHTRSTTLFYTHILFTDDYAG